MAKTDNRADYEAHLQEHIDHTSANLQEAEAYLNEHSDEISTAQKHKVEEANQRRKQSLQGFIAGRDNESRG